MRNVLQEQYGTIPDYSQQTQEWSDNLDLAPSSDQTNEEGYTDYERFLKGAWEGFTGTPSRYWDDIKQLPDGIARLMQDPPKTLSLVGDILGELAKDTLLGGPAYALLKPIVEDIYSRSQNIYSLYQQGDMENSGRETGKLVADIIINAASLAVGGEVLSSAAVRVAGVLERAGINLEEVAGLLKSERGSWVIEGADKVRKTISEVINDIKCKTPEKLLEEGWQDVTDPRKLENSLSRDYYDPKTGTKISYDPGKEGATGFEAIDHYHVHNPNYTNKKVDYYFDINGNPIGKGSKDAHIVIEVGD